VIVTAGVGRSSAAVGAAVGQSVGRGGAGEAVIAVACAWVVGALPTGDPAALQPATINAPTSTSTTTRRRGRGIGFLLRDQYNSSYY
jgi:hypothetical protein